MRKHRAAKMALSQSKIDELRVKRKLLKTIDGPEEPNQTKTWQEREWEDIQKLHTNVYGKRAPKMLPNIVNSAEQGDDDTLIDRNASETK